MNKASTAENTSSCVRSAARPISLVTVIGWRIAADAGAGAPFTIDPLWPGLVVSALLLLALSERDTRHAAGAAT